MIDTEARQLAHDALKRFLECSMDSDGYDMEYPSAELFGRKASKDRAIEAIYGMSWNWFDDLVPHRLDNEHALEPEIQKIANRCLTFLACGMEYEWREDNFMQTDSSKSVLTTLGLIRTVPAVEERIANHLDQPEGDANVWPFFRNMDFIRCSEQTSQIEVNQ